jgi:hypothetical protein
MIVIPYPFLYSFLAILGFRVVMRLDLCVPIVGGSRLIDNVPLCFSKQRGLYGFQDLHFRKVSDLRWCTLSFHRGVSDVILLVEGDTSSASRRRSQERSE